MKIDVADIARRSGIGKILDRMRSDVRPVTILEAPRDNVRGVPTSEIRFLTAQEIRDLPEPRYLIDGVLPAGSFAVMYGAPKNGKTFLALDMSLNVAMGTPFLGRDTERGSVVYIAAEGVTGLGRRLRAWEQEHGTVADVFRVVPLPVRPGDPGELAEFRKGLSGLARKPDLIVVDTLARCIVPGDENSNRDMSAFVEGLGSIQREFGCTVLVVHHCGHDDSRERGASALRGAVDTLIRVKSTGGRITVSCDAQKEDEPFPPIHVRLRRVELEQGKSSCVVEPIEPPSELPMASQQSRDMELLEAIPGEGHIQRKDLITETSIAESTLTRRLEGLFDRGLVSKVGKGRYCRTQAGNQLMAKDGE